MNAKKLEIPCPGAGPVEDMLARPDSLRLYLAGPIKRDNAGRPYVEVMGNVEQLCKRLRDGEAYCTLLADTANMIGAKSAAQWKEKP